MANYVRLTTGLSDRGRLVKPEEVYNYIKADKDYYTSVFYYNDKHLEQFKKTGTVSGINDVLTDQIVFDFDNKDDLDLAREDALTVISRMREYNIDNKDIRIYFTGNKGFEVSVKLNRTLNPGQLRYIAVNKLGKGLKSLDTAIYNASRIIRVPGTSHNVTKLYKVPLTLEQLESLSVDDIKKRASSLDNVTEEFTWDVSKPKEDLFIIQEEKPKLPEKSNEVDYSKKPSGWRNCKWSLLQGNFPAGQRHMALMVLAATCKGLGFDETTTYHMCKSASEKQAGNTGQDEFPEEELRDNIISSTFSPLWKGGQYTCQSSGWLQDYCKSLGDKSCNHDATNLPTLAITDAIGIFKDYAKNIDSLTIRTGIPALDKRLRITIGMSVGIIGAPSSGKTSLIINILNSMSRSGEQCIFFSYDMYHSLVIQKLIQKHFKMSDEKVFEEFKKGSKDFEQRVINLLNTEYGNVEFCFKTGQTPDQIAETIKYVEEKKNRKVRLAVIDYSELVSADVSDSTAASAQVAQRLRQIANSHNICVMALYQPSKLVGDPSEEINSYNAAKGSGAIGAAASVMLGISRPGFSPKHPENDNYMTINCVKNRMGSLFAVDLYFDGLTGSVRDLTEEEKSDLESLRKAIEDEKKGEDDSWS